MLERSDLDAVVIDLKDGQGRISYDTKIPILQQQKRHFLKDAKGLIAGLREAGVYTIARVVCFADPHLPKLHPERAIMHIRRNKPWVSWGTGDTWLDPYNRDNHRMIVEVTREAEALGFDEIQLDYVRFPVDDGTQYARYPSEDGTRRPALLIELLSQIDRAISIPVGVDVFGLAAYRNGDPSGLGQDLEAWVRHVEVYSPMLYLNSMRNWQRGASNRARMLVQRGVERLRERVGPRPVIRPYLQAFAKGSDGFNARFIAEQIRGARSGQADGFLFWHPGSRYSMVTRGMRGPGRQLSPFSIEKRMAVRRAGVNGRSRARKRRSVGPRVRAGSSRVVSGSPPRQR